MKRSFQRRWSLNLVLLVVVIALVSLIKLDQGAEQASPQVIAEYLPANIKEIHIDKPGKQAISLKRTNSQWELTAPYQSRADQNMVERLLAISRLEISSIISSQAINLEHAGLEQPLATVVFNDVPIVFGNSQPVGQQRYIRLGDKVMLVGDKHADQLKTASITYVDRQLIPSGSTIKSLRINGKDINLTSENSPLNQWLSTRASWLSHAPGLPDRSTSIDIILQSNEVIHYLAEQRENDIVLTNPDNSFEYHLPAHTAQALMIDFTNEDEPAPVSDQPAPMR